MWSTLRLLRSSGREAVAILADANETGELALHAREKTWLGRLRSALDALPSDEHVLLNEMEQEHGDLFDPASYDLCAV